MDLAPGSVLGSYEILAPLGAGGMGKVYRARDRKLGREVALKVVRHDVLGGPDGARRFEREARLLAAVNHPNVATLYSFEECDGLRFLVMELVVGRDLAEYRRERPLSVSQALSFAGQIARALEAAHARGIVHRDLKPANVVVTADGTVKVLDFGLAKAVLVDGSASAATGPLFDQTSEGLILGTPAYVSPEQARGEGLDARSDVWSFGCVLFELLGGRSPFARRTTADTLAAVLEREPDWSALPSSTPPHVRRVLRRCLEKDRDHRPQTIRDVRTELESGGEGGANTSAFEPRREDADVPTATLAEEARPRREEVPTATLVAPPERPRPAPRGRGCGLMGGGLLFIALGVLAVFAVVALLLYCLVSGAQRFIIEPRQYHDVTGQPGRWSATEGGLTLSVDRVEANSSGRFRVHMTATNNTKDRLTLPLFGHFAVIDEWGQQYEADSFTSTFPRDVAPGATISGYADMKEPLRADARKLKVGFSTVFGSFDVRSITVKDVAVRQRP